MSGIRTAGDGIEKASMMMGRYDKSFSEFYSTCFKTAVDYLCHGKGRSLPHDLNHAREVDDYVQDAFCVVWTHLSDGSLPEDMGQMKAYLCGVLDNKACEYQRHLISDENNDSLDSGRVVDDVEVFYAGELEKRVNEANAEQVESVLVRQEVRALVSLLPEKYRQVMTDFLDGYSMEEIAQRNGYRNDRVAISTKRKAMVMLTSYWQEKQKEDASRLPSAFFVRSPSLIHIKCSEYSKKYCILHLRAVSVCVIVG